ncbi:sensor histidine kinase [Bacillus alkalicellulosilyticus]|uniref:sensor histidine kinase n=1 Tax=Alkalihalobacterium alkalicellulosilyticum TaxID=1912214 RepID=UPI00099736FD|nr:sensor histidine kinase [Bacillus alkalicellulosilyticus]
MFSYWVWLLLLLLTWLLALLQVEGSLFAIPLRIISSAVFFAFFFLAPLFKKQKPLFLTMTSISAVFAVITFWPQPTMTPNLYVLLVFSLIAAMAVFYLIAWESVIVAFILLAGLLVPAFLGLPSISPLFIILYTVIVGSALMTFRKTKSIEEESEARAEALLSEYKKMKRQLVEDEQLARQQERTEIAREIHDSVGHKLTALLMQLEVLRLDQQQIPDAKLVELKQLAKESLEETRSAVKTLRHDEVGGLSAIIRLIRKLESESYMRIQFSIKHGALSAPLGNDQAIVIYRAVQEALTNVMRHSGGREVEVVFEAPAGGVFRFEVTNPLTSKGDIKEGFGLSSMRERMEQVGGTLEILQYDEQFIVRGTIPLQERWKK